MMHALMLEDLRRERMNSRVRRYENRRPCSADQIGAKERESAVTVPHPAALHEMAWTDEEIMAFAAVLVNYRDEPPGPLGRVGRESSHQH